MVDVKTGTAARTYRLRVDASKCDAQGVCKLVAPDWFELDRYGYAYVLPAGLSLDRNDASLWTLAQEVEATCPRSAIRVEELSPPPDPAAVDAVRTATPARPAASAAPRLLRRDPEPETFEGWRAAGGFGRRPRGALFAELRASGLRGQGGAGFPAARKWAALGPEATLVANGAEREPGTVKDAFLLGPRRFVVLDGALAAASDLGIAKVIVAIPEGERELLDGLRGAFADIVAGGAASGVDVDVVEVSRAYVAGEETALLAGLEGKPPKPRMRPPFPATQGLSGRPTLVQNVETLANIALLNAYGADWFRTAGTDEAPGTGLFSVGRFDEGFALFERPFGTSLRGLLADAGLADDVGAVLAGGYSGGLLRPDQLDVGLSLGALNSAGARLGTKSIQVLREGTCPLRTAIAVLRFFAAETAEQCPPCYRGLPEMADLLQQVEDGTAAAKNASPRFESSWAR